ncbi:MAG: AGE family epimerase/isomerase [Opitutales bacterium]|nr:AGE family epimerase/isomerase [Opitutales bacterium]
MLNLPRKLWNERLCNILAPNWLEQASTESGLFLPDLDRKWQRTGSSEATVVSQSRLIYVFAESFRQTREKQYSDAVQKGADCLLRDFWDPQNGGFVWSYDLSRGVIDDQKSCYGHAFAIFGLCHAHRAGADPRHLQFALETVELVHQKFSDCRGGLKPLLQRDFSGDTSYRSQNPVMHLVEALLAMSETLPSGPHLQQAQSWIDFLFKGVHSRQESALPEFYAVDWSPLTIPPPESEEPGCICPGHQLEWAYLLSKAVELGLPDPYMDTARFALDAGLQFGRDPIHGGIIRATDMDGTVCDDRKVFWQQTEAIRSLARFAIHHGIKEYEAPLMESLDFLNEHLWDHTFGGIYTQVHRDGSPMNQDKGSAWKVDYHTVSMISELLSLSS